MNAKVSLRLLQIVLGVVLFLYSAQLMIAQLHGTHHRPALLLFLILGGVEALAALIFLFSVPVGGPLLLATFVAAALLHALHGQLGPIGGLLIDAAAVIAVMSGKRG